jgi:hypothetical protein
MAPSESAVAEAPPTNNLEALCKSVKKQGLMGVALIIQGGSKPYVAACLGKEGRVVDPRTWDSYREPEEALNALADKLVLDRAEKQG